jgi:hypothetical protein
LSVADTAQKATPPHTNEYCPPGSSVADKPSAGAHDVKETKGGDLAWTHNGWIKSVAKESNEPNVLSDVNEGASI